MFTAGLVATGLLAGVYYLFDRYLADSASTTFDIARTTATLNGVLGAALLAAIAIRRQISNEASHNLERQRRDDELERHQTQQDRLDQDTDRAIVAGLRDRYTTAAEQLGHESSAIRLAGVYAMAALADDWSARNNKAQTQTCIEVLCSMLRSPRYLVRGP